MSETARVIEGLEDKARTSLNNHQGGMSIDEQVHLGVAISSIVQAKHEHARGCPRCKAERVPRGSATVAAEAV